MCLSKVVKCHGCIEPYAVLQPLTSCSATLTFLCHDPSYSDAGCAGTQKLHRHSNIDDNSCQKKCTAEFISSVLCKVPVLSCNQGMCWVLLLGYQNITTLAYFVTTNSRSG